MTNKRAIVYSRSAVVSQVWITRIGDFMKELGIIDVRYIINVSKFRKCSLVADKRLRSGLKAQQAHSPGQRPGLVNRRKVRPARAKAFLQNG